MICHYCGAELPDNSLHCPSCHAPMDSVTQQLVSYRQQTQAHSAPARPQKAEQKVQRVHESALRSHKILMIIAGLLFLAILAVLAVSQFL